MDNHDPGDEHRDPPKKPAPPEYEETLPGVFRRVGSTDWWCDVW